MSGGKDQTTIFNCIVRSRDTKTIVIKNPSNQKWTIRPIIDGTDSNWWLGPDRVVIEPQTSKPVEFTYRPLMMTQANRKHQVKLNYYFDDKFFTWQIIVATLSTYSYVSC